MRISNYLFQKKFLTKEECNQLINEGKKGLHEAQVFDQENNDIKSSIRETNVSFFKKGNVVDKILEKVIDCIGLTAINYYGVSITDIEPIQYAEYEIGMFYGWHTDSGTTVRQSIKRDISASLILNDKSEYTGGSLQMVLSHNISRDNVITPQDVEDQEQGTLIIFPSSMIHQVTPVLSGVRKSLVLWSCSNVKPA
tara:strand:- start:51 stop:638 length:588 start_codon:yes stop_codon:yes gene_type:complete